MLICIFALLHGTLYAHYCTPMTAINQPNAEANTTEFILWIHAHSTEIRVSINVDFQHKSAGPRNDVEPQFDLLSLRL